MADVLQFKLDRRRRLRIAAAAPPSAAVQATLNVLVNDLQILAFLEPDTLLALATTAHTFASQYRVG